MSITTKELTFRKVRCTVTFTKHECATIVEVKGKRIATGSYPPDHKDKKGYLIRLLKAATG